MAEENKPIDTVQQPASEQSNLPAPETNKIQKTSWPELVGVTAEEAEKKIKEDRPDVSVQVVKPGQPVTKDFRTDRVRIFVDAAGKVERAPTIG